VWSNAALNRTCRRKRPWYFAHDNRLKENLAFREILVRLAGIEPTTLGFGGQYSIH
jgi:hypothetical protein